MKPFDPGPVSEKLDKLEKLGHNVKALRECCPNTAEIHDAKDFKPYIMAAVEQFAEVMDLEVRKNSYNG